mmetsp:Transcript_97730/g.309911  ORF Transcript_97730/g.309911 Transcript_97730/m.309911 type:complete len:88 (-) Transcript_97730:10-273(-)
MHEDVHEDIRNSNGRAARAAFRRGWGFYLPGTFPGVGWSGRWLVGVPMPVSLVLFFFEAGRLTGCSKTSAFQATSDACHRERQCLRW